MWNKRNSFKSIYFFINNEINDGELEKLNNQCIKKLINLKIFNLDLRKYIFI